VRHAYDVASPRQAHEAVNHLYQEVIKPHTRKGAQGRVIFETVNTHLRHELRKMFHGPILTDFSQQVRLPDPVTGKLVRYSPRAWKFHLKDLFCPAQFDENTGAELPKSTEALSDDEFSEFLVAVQAYGVVDLGITFTEKDH
jgi:hypothetical protein